MNKEELVALIEDAEFSLEYKATLSQTLFLMGHYIQYNEYSEAFVRKIKVYIGQLREECLFAINTELDFKKKKHIKKIIDEVVEESELFLVLVLMTEG